MSATQGNALNALTGFLAGLGLETTDTITSVEDTLTSYLHTKGITATFDGLQHGLLTITGTASAIALLKYEQHHLLDTLHQAGHTQINDIRLRVTRP